MPLEFQRVVDSIHIKFPQANAFIDDIFLTIKGTKIEHISLMEKIPKTNIHLKSFMSPIKSLHKHLQALADLSSPARLQLSI